MAADAVPLFVNPAAGRGRAGKHCASIAALLGANGIRVEAIESRGVGHMEDLVKSHASGGSSTIIVVGGDGSVHEAVNGILRSGGKTAFGLIPMGTGNDFAKACDISLNWREACGQIAECLRSGRAGKPVDAGRMNDRYFANGAGIGFDAKINRLARRYRLPIGDLVYLLAVFEGIVDGVITPSVRMRFDDREIEGPVTLANVSNGPWVGGMFHIAPGASNDDGKFDLVYADPVSRWRVVGLLPKLMRGSHYGEPDIHTAGITRFELQSDESLPSHLDGETQPLQSEFRIELLPGALSVI
jgi:YegS/Rv2252/BmrU family lipid kinase